MGGKKGEKKPNNPETTVVQMTQYIPWSLDHKKDWELKNWCFQMVVAREDSLESLGLQGD